MQSQNSLSEMVACVPSTLTGILSRDTADPLSSPMSTGLSSIEQMWSLRLGRPYHDLLMGLRANQIPAAPIPLPETFSLRPPPTGNWFCKWIPNIQEIHSGSG